MHTKIRQFAYLQNIPQQHNKLREFPKQSTNFIHANVYLNQETDLVSSGRPQVQNKKINRIKQHFKEPLSKYK